MNKEPKMSNKQGQNNNIKKSKINTSQRQTGLSQISKQSLKDSVAILKQQLKHFESSLNLFVLEFFSFLFLLAS